MNASGVSEWLTNSTDVDDGLVASTYSHLIRNVAFLACSVLLYLTVGAAVLLNGVQMALLRRHMSVSATIRLMLINVGASSALLAVLLVARHTYIVAAVYVDAGRDHRLLPPLDSNEMYSCLSSAAIIGALTNHALSTLTAALVLVVKNGHRPQHVQSYRTCCIVGVVVVVVAVGHWSLMSAARPTDKRGDDVSYYRNYRNPPTFLCRWDACTVPATVVAVTVANLLLLVVVSTSRRTQMLVSTGSSTDTAARHSLHQRFQLYNRYSTGVSLLPVTVCQLLLLLALVLLNCAFVPLGLGRHTANSVVLTSFAFASPALIIRFNRFLNIEFEKRFGRVHAALCACRPTAPRSVVHYRTTLHPCTDLIESFWLMHHQSSHIRVLTVRRPPPAPNQAPSTTTNP